MSIRLDSEIDFENLKELCSKKNIRKFNDMKDSYKNPEKIKTNPLIYTVYRKDFGDFETGLNVMEPGTINKEFFMTKGHNHEKAKDEIYILISGKGKLLIQEKKTKIFNLKKNKVYVIPGKSGHRLINTGNKKLVVLTIYNKDAGRSYSLRFKKRFFKE